MKITITITRAEELHLLPGKYGGDHDFSDSCETVTYIMKKVVKAIKKENKK